MDKFEDEPNRPNRFGVVTKKHPPVIKNYQKMLKMNWNFAWTVSMQGKTRIWNKNTKNKSHSNRNIDPHRFFEILFLTRKFAFWVIHSPGSGYMKAALKVLMYMFGTKCVVDSCGRWKASYQNKWTYDTMILCLSISVFTRFFFTR